MKKSTTHQLVPAAMFVALGVLFPNLFHLFGATAGKVFLPMHIPVLVCGLVCGPMSGALCGLLTPLLSSSLTGMPELFPQAVIMMGELCAYGLVSGLLSVKTSLYPALIGAMLTGRLVSGAAGAVLFGLSGKSYGLNAFLTATFVTAIPGILLQLVLVPTLVFALRRTGAFGERRVRLI